jgi:CHAD domain-containing protein
MASSRAKRTLKRSAADRRTQLAAGGLLAAGAALVGKAALERGESDTSSSGASRAYRLKGKEDPVEGIVRIATGRAEKALEELRRAGEGDDLAGSVHSARKDLKKVRSVLRLICSAIGEKRFRTENKRYRDAGRRLSASRDAEVKLETLAGLAERFDEELPGEAVKAWRALLSEEHEELGDEDALAVQIESAISEIEVGRDEIGRWQLSEDSWDLFAPGIGRTYKRGRREMKRVRAKRRGEDVHQWRKRVKDLWYQLRIVRKMWPALLGETAGQAHELADLLGDHHDLTVLHDDLKAREELSDEKALATAIERRQDELLDRALDLGARLYAEKPKALLRRLSAYWESWREG